MSGKRKSKNSCEPFEAVNGHEHFTRLYDSMLESSAYRSLSHAARTVYIELKKQYKGSYTGDTVICPYKVFQEYGMNTVTIKNALCDLEEKGFIEVIQGTPQAQGCNIRRQANQYRFTSAWKNYDPDERE